MWLGTKGQMSAEFRRFSPFLTGLLVSTALIAAPESPRADDSMDDGGPIYLDLSAGATLLNDTDLEGTGIDTTAEFDIGPAGRIAIGHGYAGGWRADVELSVRSNDADSIGSSSGSGDILAISGLVNGYKDFDLGSGFTPYVGLGVGAIRVDTDGLSPVGTSRVSDDDTTFAYQGTLGGAWEIDHGWSLTGEYRYLASTDLDLATAGGTGLDPTYRSHTVFIGIRLDLGTLGPAMAEEGGMGSGDGENAMAKSGDGAATAATSNDTGGGGEGSATASAASGETAGADDGAGTQQAAADATGDLARAYRVFFDLDSAALTPIAESILEQLASNAKDGEVIRIEATGHADASGTQSHNMALSKSRAVQVKAALVRMGVPPDQIVIAWKGETELLVPTDDGVPEQQNRRVEIVFPE